VLARGAAGKLYAVPRNVDSVLIVDPLTNATNVTAITGAGSRLNKYLGSAFAPISGKIYAPPYNTTSWLVIDPDSNASDTTTLTVNVTTTCCLFSGVAFAPTTLKLYATPGYHHSVLVLDPLTNETFEMYVAQVTTGAGGVGASTGGVAFADNSRKLYAAPRGATYVLIIDPELNTTDITTLGGLSNATSKWQGIVYVRIVPPTPPASCCCPLSCHSSSLIFPLSVTAMLSPHVARLASARMAQSAGTYGWWHGRSRRRANCTVLRETHSQS
jgi:hypothetical protein